MDLSCCKLEDKGALAVGEFLSLHKKLKALSVANNDIGPNGVSGIIYGLLKRQYSILRVLDLKLNPLLNTGASHVCACKCTKDWVASSIVSRANICTCLSYRIYGHDCISAEQTPILTSVQLISGSSRWELSTVSCLSFVSSLCCLHCERRVFKGKESRRASWIDKACKFKMEI